MFRNDCNTGNKGGGVLLYAKYNLDPVQFVLQTKFPDHVWCKVKSKDGIELLIGVCYNSNNGKIFSSDTHLLLRQLLCEVSQYHVLIMGDFNYPDIHWETLAATDRASTDVKMFVECLMDNFYTQQVTQPTRGTAVLDLVITSEPDMVDELLVLEGLGSSDYSVLLWTCQFGKKRG